MPNTKQGSEVEADKQRDDDKPKYHGKDWDVAQTEAPAGATKDSETTRQPDSGRADRGRNER